MACLITLEKMRVIVRFNGDAKVINAGIRLIPDGLKPRLYAQFAPWCKFTPGSKIAPGSKSAPPYVAFICQ